MLNGWQVIGENNDAKAVGAKISYSNDRLSASFNTFSGPELADNDDDWRHFGNILVIWEATPRLSVGGSLDRGHQEMPDADAADWTGVGGYARYAINEHIAIAARAEQFDDPDNGISGSAQKLREGTLTLEYRPLEKLLLKLEARHDRSTAAVFQEGDGDFSKTQTLVLLGAVVSF